MSARRGAQLRAVSATRATGGCTIYEVLAQFSALYWTVAGSASLWLWLYVNGRNPFWTPGDVNVSYIGETGSDSSAPFRSLDPVFPDPDAQPKDVVPFQFSGNWGPYFVCRRSAVIYRRGMKIDALFETSIVGRRESGTPRCQFDFRFLQIAVNLSPDQQQFLSYFTSEGSREILTPCRINKYSARLEGETMSDMSSMVFVLGNNDDAIVVPRAIF